MIVRQGARKPVSQAQRDYQPGNPFRFLSLSRLEPNKRIDWILRAFALLEKRNPPLSAGLPWTLDIVGQGAERTRLEALAAELGLGSKVRFHGHLSDEQLENIYAQTGIFLMPAVQGYGLPALEALLRHVPVLLHEESGVSEVLRGSAWVEIIDGGIEALAEGIIRFVSRLSKPEIWRSPLPDIRTDQQWAEQMSDVCGWITA
jgi:glycosyltransferase involved in cell wall biosynthesis